MCHKWRPYVWFLSTAHNFLSFWAIFCSFTPLTTTKNQLGDRQFFVPFWAFFVLLPHYWPQKLKFGKNVKNTWKCYHFTLVNHKWRSFDVWCLRYKVWQRVFSHLGPFRAWRYSHFTQVHQKLWSDDIRFLRYGAQQTDEWTDRRMDERKYMDKWTYNGWLTT